MTEENEVAAPKKLVRVEGEMLIIEKSGVVDPNKDGEPLLEMGGYVKIHLSELPDELYDYWKNRKK